MKKTETKQKIIVLLSVIFVVFSVVVFVNASFSSDEKNSTMKTYTVDKERAKKEAQIRKELDEKVKNGTQSWRKEKRLKEIQERNKQQKNNTIRVGSRMKTADLVICASTRSVLNEATSASHSGDIGTMFSLTTANLVVLLPANTEVLVKEVDKSGSFHSIRVVVQNAPYIGTSCHTYKPKPSKLHKYFTIDQN